MIKNKELLAPAGDMECLKAAVKGGADAIYFASKMFGARKYAANFSNEEIIEAIKYCHLYGVKVFVTMNTLVKNDEVDAFIEQAKFLYEHGVDALLIQDFGMICLLREILPDLEIHASTQANNSTYDTVKLFYDLGVKRVVFSREVSIDEIDSIDIPIEKEAFIHGALCISYSGNCLMSSMIGHRSGNRGECAGTCRLKYSLEDNDKVIIKDKYLLSTKELNSTHNIDRLINSSVYSLKIEGRMKSPLYVEFITRLYRRLIDGEKFNLLEEENKLKTIFNREFTKGRIFNESDSNFMNTLSPNHVGLKIGSSEVYKDKIKIILDNNVTLRQFDAIRFNNSKKGMIINFLYDKKMNLCSDATGICYVDNKLNIDSNDTVSKTQDVYVEKEINELPNKKINIKFSVYAHVGEELIIKISDYDNEITSTLGVVDKSINRPISRDDIKEKLSKLGDTPFICNDFDIDIDDNIFIQLKVLNEARRDLVDKLINKRYKCLRDCNLLDFNYSYDDRISTSSISVEVRCEEDIKYLIDKVDYIYVRDYELYKKYEEYNNIYYVLDRNISDREFGKNNLVGDYLDFSKGEFRGTYSLNVTNIYTGYFLKELGLKNIPISVELSDKEIISYIKLYKEKFGYGDFEIFRYGRVENMLIYGNILDINKDKNRYNLIDIRNNKFPVYYDGRLTRVLNYEIFNLEKLGYCNYISLYDMDNNIKDIIIKFN